MLSYRFGLNVSRSYWTSVSSIAHPHERLHRFTKRRRGIGVPWIEQRHIGNLILPLLHDPKRRRACPWQDEAKRPTHHSDSSLALSSFAVGAMAGPSSHENANRIPPSVRGKLRIPQSSRKRQSDLSGFVARRQVAVCIRKRSI